MLNLLFRASPGAKPTCPTTVSIRFIGDERIEAEGETQTKLALGGTEARSLQTNIGAGMI